MDYHHSQGASSAGPPSIPHLLDLPTWPPASPPDESSSDEDMLEAHGSFLFPISFALRAVLIFILGAWLAYFGHEIITLL